MLARQRLSALAALAIVLAGHGSGCGGADAGVPPPVHIDDGYFGINGHVLRQLALSGQYEELDRHLASISELGVSFVRAPVDWVSLEPSAPNGDSHRYDYQSLDLWVGSLARRGLRWYAVGVGAAVPAWAAAPESLAAGCPGVSAAPARADDVAEMLRALAERYGRGGSFWREHPSLPREPVVEYEVWNEENHGASWCPNPEPAAYADTYLAARSKVHAVEPRAQVVFGALAPSP